MRTPFPGMDPYLERPALWPDVHNALIASLRDALGPVLRPKYFVALEERVYTDDPGGLTLIGRPDLSVTQEPGAVATRTKARQPHASVVEVPVPDQVKETYLVVKSEPGDDELTVIEVLSPGNKRKGPGRRIYEKKRMEILGTRTSLVEIDLLRAGRPMTVFGAKETSDYCILVSRGNRRPRADILSFGVRDPIPTFVLPLQPRDAEPDVDLGAVLHALYERASYDLVIDYKAEPVPPLAEADRAWAHDVLAGAKLR